MDFLSNVYTDVFSVVILIGNVTHILPVLHWLEVVIDFVSSWLLSLVLLLKRIFLFYAISPDLQMDKISNFEHDFVLIMNKRCYYYYAKCGRLAQIIWLLTGEWTNAKLGSDSVRCWRRSRTATVEVLFIATSRPRTCFLTHHSTSRSPVFHPRSFRWERMGTLILNLKYRSDNESKLNSAEWLAYSQDSVNGNSLMVHLVSSAVKTANWLHLSGHFLAHQRNSLWAKTAIESLITWVGQ